jgi:hypothetical protein
MNFAYISGQEEAALTYFEARLAATFDLREREKLKEIVKNLRKQLRLQGKKPPPKVATAFELSGVSARSGL